MTTTHHRWVLSGGLASGKSKVRELLEEHGITTIDADSIGHAVIRSDGPAFTAVAERWPEALEGGEINRALLGEIVFGSREELARLEAITHPHIFDELSRQVKDIATTVVVEIPLLQHRLGTVWRRLIVDCPDKIRLERAVARGTSLDDAKAIMAVQPSRARWLSVADAVIPNWSTIQELRSTVTGLIPKL